MPLLARVYPNGEADVNRFAAAGGLPFVFRELLDAGLMHADIPTVVPGGMRAHADEPRIDGDSLAYAPSAAASGDDAVLRPVANAFEAQGGLRLLNGNLGRAVFKAVRAQARTPPHRGACGRGRQPAGAEQAARGRRLPRDFVAVVRFQGPHANGMPEMHSLTPLLGMLQNQAGAALVTDGRLSGASGKIPAAIHVTPEAARGGPLAKLRDGDAIRIDGEAGTLEVLVAAAEWEARAAQVDATPPASGMGRNLFALNRAGDARRPWRLVDFLRPA